MTAAEAVERQAAHENLLDQVIHALQRADAVLWAQEVTKGIDHTDTREQIGQALKRAYKESLQ